MRFTALERRWITDSMESFAPVGNAGLTVAAGEVDFVRAVETFAANSTLRGKLGLRLAVWMAGLAPLIILGQLRTISSMAMDARAEVITRLQTHRVYAIRGLSLLIKVGASFAIFGDPSLRARSGYDKPSSSARRAQERARRSLPVVALAHRKVA